MESFSKYFTFDELTNSSHIELVENIILGSITHTHSYSSVLLIEIGTPLLHTKSTVVIIPSSRLFISI